MNNPPILVNGKPFFGRKEEQRDFRNDLNRALNPDPDEANDPNPFIIYLFGDGGMGKTTLLRRFRDIVKADVPAFTVTYIDWETERQRSTALQGERKRILLTAVLDSFYRALLEQHPDWHKPLEAYQVALERHEQVRLQAETLFQSHDERDPLAPLRGVGATFIGKFVRAGAEGAGMAVGDEGETALTVLAEMGIQATESQAKRLAHQAEQRLRAKLSRDDLKMLLNPNLTLAQQLGAALKRISTPGGFSGKRPLLFFWDTYEIIDANDTWLREMMNAAGANTVWVLAGRNDLVRSRQYGKEFFTGYQDVATRFRPFDMKQLTLGDVRDYFNVVAPEPPLDERTAAAIFQATHAIPLAVREAADLWKKGIPLSEIVADTGATKSGAHIVRVMTERYHLHCINHLTDKYDLYALALANGDSDLLRALLQPTAADPDWHLGNRLRELERAYASVHRDPARLHEDAATFFTEHLRHPDRRRENRTVALIDRAIANLEPRLAEAEAPLRLIEARHDDETWRDLALKLADFYFWKSEAEGWRWLTPRYVESTIYSRPMRDGLLKVLGQWKPHLSKQGQKRTEILEAAQESFLYQIDPDVVAEMLRWREAKWLDEEGKEERGAILTYWQAQVAYGGEKYEETLKRYESLKGLPEGGKQLKHHVVEGLNDLCRKFIWPHNAKSSKASPHALRAGKLGMTLDQSHTGILYNYATTLNDARKNEDSLNVWNRYFALKGESASAADYHGLGNVYNNLKQYDAAIAAYQQAIRLDPSDAAPHHGLGNVYDNLKQYNAAIAAYREAIRLTPAYSYPHNGLGVVYSNLKQYDKAIAAFKEAIRLDPTLAGYHNNLGNVYRNLKQYDEAITAYREAIRLDPADAYPHHGLGNVYRDLKQYDEAIAAYREAIHLDPALATPHNNLGNVYRALKQYDAAIAAYQHAIRLDPAFVYPHYGLGTVYRDLKQYDAAIAAYQTAIRLDPADSDYHDNLGNVYRDLKQYDKAIISYREAIRLDPSLASAHASLAACYRLQNNYAGYSEHITKARTLMQTEGDYNKACIEAIAGNHEEALRLLKEGLISPQELHLAQTDPDFDTLRDDPRFRALVGLDDPTPS